MKDRDKPSKSVTAWTKEIRTMTSKIRYGRSLESVAALAEAICENPALNWLTMNYVGDSLDDYYVVMMTYTDRKRRMIAHVAMSIVGLIAISPVYWTLFTSYVKQFEDIRRMVLILLVSLGQATIIVLGIVLLYKVIKDWRDLAKGWIRDRWASREFFEDVFRLAKIVAAYLNIQPPSNMSDIGAFTSLLSGNEEETRNTSRPQHVFDAWNATLLREAMGVKKCEKIIAAGETFEKMKAGVKNPFELGKRMKLIAKDVRVEEIYAAAAKAVEAEAQQKEALKAQILG